MRSIYRAAIIWSSIPVFEGDFFDQGEALWTVDRRTTLGISALETNIRPLRATMVARAYPQVNTVQYEFAFMDMEYPVMPYAMMGANPLATFFPPTPMSAQYAAMLRSQQSGGSLIPIRKTAPAIAWLYWGQRRMASI